MIGPFQSEHLSCGESLTDNSGQKVNFTPCAAAESGNYLYAVCTSQGSTTDIFNSGILCNSDLSSEERTLYPCRSLSGYSNEEVLYGYSPRRNRQNSMLNRSRKVSNKSRAIYKRTGKKYQRKNLSKNNSISFDVVSQGKKEIGMKSFDEGRFRRLPALDTKKDTFSIPNTEDSAMKNMFLRNVHRTDSPTNGGNISANRNDDLHVVTFKCCVDCIGHARCTNYMTADATAGTEAELPRMEDRNGKDEVNFKADNSNNADLNNKGDTQLSEQKQGNEHKEEMYNCTYENDNPEKGKRECFWKNGGLIDEKEQTDAYNDLVEKSTLHDGKENKLELPVSMQEKSPSDNPPKDGRWRRKRTASNNGSNVSARKNVKKDCKWNTQICPNENSKEHMYIEGFNDQLNNPWRNDEQGHYGKEKQIYVPCSTIEEALESNKIGAPSKWRRNTESIGGCKEHPKEENLINSWNKWNVLSTDVNKNVALCESEGYIPHQEMKEEHAENYQMMEIGITRNEHMCESNLAVPLNHFNAATQGENYYMANKIGTDKTAYPCTNELALSKETQWNRNNYGKVESSIEGLLGRRIWEENFYEGQHITGDISNEHILRADIWQGYSTAGYPVGGNPVENCPVRSHAMEDNPVEAYPLESYPVDIYPVESYPLEIYPLASNWVGSNPLENYPPRWVIKKEQCYSVPEVPVEVEAFAWEAANLSKREELGKQEKQNAHMNTCFLSNMNKEELTLPSKVTNMEAHAKGKINVHSILNNNKCCSCRMKGKIKMEVPDLVVYFTQGATSSKLHTIANIAGNTATGARTSSIIHVPNNDNLTDTLSNKFDLKNHTDMLYFIQGGLRDDRRIVCSHTHMLDPSVSANMLMPGGSASTPLIVPNTHMDTLGAIAYTTRISPNTNVPILMDCAPSRGHGENALVLPGNDVIQANNEAFSVGAINNYYIPYPGWDNYSNFWTQQNFSPYQYPYIKSMWPNEYMSISVENCSGYPYNHPIGVSHFGVLDPKCADNYFYPSWDNSLQRFGANEVCYYNGIRYDGTFNFNGANLFYHNLGFNNCEFSQEGNNFLCTDVFPNYGGNSCVTSTYHNFPSSQALITQGYSYYQNDPQMAISNASYNLKDQYKQNGSNKRDLFSRCSVRGEYYCTPNTNSTRVIPENNFFLIEGNNNSIIGHIRREQMNPEDGTDVIPDVSYQSVPYIHGAAWNGNPHISANNCSSYPVVNLNEGESYSPGAVGKWEVMPHESKNNEGNDDWRTKENTARELEATNVQVSDQERDMGGHLPGDGKGGHTNGIEVKVKRKASSDVQSHYESCNESDDQPDDQPDDLQRIAVSSPHNTPTPKNDECVHANGKIGEANSLNYYRTKCTREGTNNYNKQGVENLSTDRGNSIINRDIRYEVCFLENDYKGNCCAALCTNRDDTLARPGSANKILKNISACDRWNSGKERKNLCSYSPNGEREYDACGHWSRIDLPYFSNHHVYKIRYPVDHGYSHSPHSFRGDMVSNWHLSSLGATNQVNLHCADFFRNYVNVNAPESVAHVTGGGSYPRDNFYNLNWYGYAHRLGHSGTLANAVTFNHACWPSYTSHPQHPYDLNYYTYYNHTNEHPLDYQHFPNDKNFGVNWNHSRETFQLCLPHCYANIDYTLEKPFYFLDNYFLAASDEVRNLSVNKINTIETNVSRVTNGIALKDLIQGTNSSEGTNIFRIKSELANEDDISPTNVPISSKCNNTFDIKTSPLHNKTYNLLSISTKCDSLGFNNDDGALVHGGASPTGVNQREKVNTIAVKEEHYGACILEGDSNTFQIGEGNGSKDGAEVNTHAWGEKYFGSCVMENMEKCEDGIKLQKLGSSQMCVPRVKAEEDGNGAESDTACTPLNCAHCKSEGDMYINEGMRDECSIFVKIEINEKGDANNGDVSGYQNKTECTHDDGNIVQHLNGMDAHLENMNCMYTDGEYNYLNEEYFLNNCVNEVNSPNDIWQGRNSLSYADYEEYMEQYSYSHSHMSGMCAHLDEESKEELTDGRNGDSEDNGSHSESVHGSVSRSDSERDSLDDRTNESVPHSTDRPLECENNMYGSEHVSDSLYCTGHIANNSSVIYSDMPADGGNEDAILDETDFDGMNSEQYNGTSPGGINNTDGNIVEGYSYGYLSELLSNYLYCYAHGVSTHSDEDGNQSVIPSCTPENTNGSTQDAENISDEQVDRLSCEYTESDSDGANESDEDTDEEVNSENPTDEKGSVCMPNVGSVNNTSTGNTIITNIGSESRANTTSSTRTTENSRSTNDGDNSPNRVNRIKSEITTCSVNDTQKEDGCIKQCKGEQMDHTIKIKSEKELKKRGRKRKNANDFTYVQEKEIVKKRYNIQKEVVLTMEEGDLKVIAEEIIKNTRLLPKRGPNGRSTLDSSHPMHSVWKDTYGGNCSWRCRWWENGKRISKNYNIKRYGEEDSLKMAIITKLRNSSPEERILYLNYQREFLNFCYANNWIPKGESDRGEEDQDAAKETTEKDDLLNGEQRSNEVGDMDAQETNKQCDQEKDSEATTSSVPLITCSTNNFSDDASAPLHGHNLRSRNKRTLCTNTGSSKKCRILKCNADDPNIDTVGHHQQGNGTNAINERNAEHALSERSALNAVKAEVEVKLEMM
ncbi:AP2 family [Plasmodium coatneyi]|uniref:AP2 family n=1 Tax=Plasmodium coatneyi TaxID=208452 RepID=A0A1B1E7S0_9APIC|nr:AP2 family [Plasmodium coatneyi]ANQ11082.1 AP2 family [Plasmodium coatneyi]